MLKENIKPIAFYLPQFHRIKENDEWWGKGFTEWTNVAKAKENFVGHYQPHVPSEMGFYDLDDVERMREQAKMALDHGIYGFCFYYYRFKGGRRILEKPIEQYAESNIDFPFCYCWANENWTRTWDGLDKDVLLEQNHGGKDDLDFLKELLPVFNDPRYIKVDGKPVLLVYRVDLFENPIALTEKWRQMVYDSGFPGIHLCCVQFYGVENPSDFGFDAAVEFPPHTFIGPENRAFENIELKNSKFNGGIIDYRKVVSQAINKPDSTYLRYRGIIPSWDNTARRQNTSHILVNSNPNQYRFWLNYIANRTLHDEKNKSKFVFINAWNEWAEGAHLEPDLKYGLRYLEATLHVVNNKKIDIRNYVINDEILDFLLKDLGSNEVRSLNSAFRLTYHGVLGEQSNAPRSVENDSNTVSLRKVFKEKYPRLAKTLISYYLKLRAMI